MIDGSVAAAAETLSNSFDFWAEGGIGARRKRGIGEEEGQAGGGRQIPEHHGHKGQEEEEEGASERATTAPPTR